ncbi:arylamine N-acetyltransferase [Otariodibacter sp.]|uniref:arylamine N-acetyltransferase family protein n=1 Tax=Otariodibacter sp. TaxID=3030919 RepID=UPI0026287192|nr:arylamine N-acetyltransferase [Otariodibacter sp.]
MNTQTIIKNYLADLNITKNITNLEDISNLASAHLKRYFFGNPKILVGEEVPIDLESIYNNIVVNKRGGYCFEHNKLMYEVLKNLGFEVTQHLARILNNDIPKIPMTHRVTILHYQGEKYLVDVGVGFRSPSVIIKFDENNTSSIGHLNTEYKLSSNELGLYTLQRKEKGHYFNIYQFNLFDNIDADFEMGNFYCYGNPTSIWRNHLIMSCFTEDAIYSLHNNVYYRINSKQIDQIEITEVNQFIEIIQNELKANYSHEELTEIFEKHIKQK